jgi:nucleotide-binding universal stress UspA family protein
MTPKTMVIGCDLEGTSRIVAEAGLAVGDRLGLVPRFVHVDSYGHLLAETFHQVDPAKLEEMRGAYRDNALQEMRHLAEKLGRDPRTLEMLVCQGKAYEQLSEVANTGAAELVVVGARGRHEIDKVGVGSTALRAVRESLGAVLTVNTRHGWSGISRIVYATDLEDNHEEVTRWVARLAAAFGAHVSVLHVSEVGGRTAPPYLFPRPVLDGYHEIVIHRLEALKKRLLELAGSFTTSLPRAETHLVLSSRVPQAVGDLAAEERADLIAMGTHGRRGLAKMLLGSVAEGVLRRAATSVLTVRSVTGAR